MPRTSASTVLRRGWEALHASAVLSPQGVVAFCAGSGTGKSTIARGLSERGYQLCADDAVAVKADFAINRRDFNINYPGMPNDLIRDNVVIKLDLQATPGPPRPENQLVN